MVQEIIGAPVMCVQDTHSAWEILKNCEVALLVADDSLGLEALRKLLRDIGDSDLSETLKVILTTRSLVQALTDFPGNPATTLVLDLPVDPDSLRDCFRMHLGVDFRDAEIRDSGVSGWLDDGKPMHIEASENNEQQPLLFRCEDLAVKASISGLSSESRPVPEAGGPTALLVDDSAVTLHMLRRYLKDLGFSTVLVAKDGEKAWELLESGKRIDLVVSDWRMPKRTGIQLLHMMRSSDAHRALPFIMISSEAAVDSILKAGKNDATAYVVKPFTFQSVRNAVQTALGDVMLADAELRRAL